MTQVLVIDDDPQMRRLLGRILHAAGHAVIAAENGRLGLDLFRSHRPPLVLDDDPAVGRRIGRAIDDDARLRQRGQGVAVAVNISEPEPQPHRLSRSAGRIASPAPLDDVALRLARRMAA